METQGRVKFEEVTSNNNIWNITTQQLTTTNATAQVGAEPAATAGSGAAAAAGIGQTAAGGAGIQFKFSGPTCPTCRKEPSPF